MWCSQPLPDSAQARKRAKCWQRRIVCKGDVGLFAFQVFIKCGLLLWGKARLGYVIPILQNACHSAPKGWDVKGGIPQNACWRLGGGEVEARQTMKDDRATPKTRDVQFHTRATQWNCLQHVRSAVWQHERESFKFCFAYGGLWTPPLVNQAHVCVCSGRAGGNERRLFFFVRYVETWPPIPSIA